MDHTLPDTILAGYRAVLGRDHGKYRNHVQRVFHACLLFDADPANATTYAIAAAFHDIGIWTDRTIDYLGPSMAQAEAYLRAKHMPGRIEEVKALIEWHHKVHRYRGPHERTVEVFRKADWTDVSMGLMRFGADRRRLREGRKRFPDLGFHAFLLKRIAQRFLRHPLDPLPMFRR